MHIHDCSKCEVKDCPLRDIAPWLNEHEKETDAAILEAKPRLLDSCMIVARGIPIPVYDKEAIVMGIEAAFCLGYHLGRTHQEVPEVEK